MLTNSHLWEPRGKSTVGMAYSQCGDSLQIWPDRYKHELTEDSHAVVLPRLMVQFWDISFTGFDVGKTARGCGKAQILLKELKSQPDQYDRKTIRRNKELGKHNTPST